MENVEFIKKGNVTMTKENWERNSFFEEVFKAKESGDFEKEKRCWMDLSKWELKDKFGIENLTTIEGVHLRKITEQVMAEQMVMETRRDDLVKKGDKKGLHEIFYSLYDDLNMEIVHRWLLDLYGINQYDIPGQIDEPFKAYLSRVRENAHKP